MPKARCDVYTSKKRCSNQAYAEAYWKRKNSWSYVCKKHFSSERRKIKMWGILEEWWIEDRLWNALRKVEKRFGICSSKNKTIKWCLFTEFHKEISKLAQKIFESAKKHKTK